MLFRFYFNKSFKEQKRALFLLPIGSVILVVLSVAAVLYMPNLLTSFTSRLVESSYALIGEGKEGALLIAALIGNGPILAAVFCGMIGANISAGMIDIEIRSGAFETILSMNHTFSRVLGTIFFTSLILGLITTAVLVAFISLIMICAISYYQMPLEVFPLYMLVVPFVCLLSGLAGGFSLQILLPRMAKVKAASTAGISQAAALFPTILLIIVFVLPIDIGIWGKVLYFSLFLICVSALVLSIAIKRVSLAQILER